MLCAILIVYIFSFGVTWVRCEQAADVLARELVPGDVVLVKSGDRIPADCRLVQTADLFVDESRCALFWPAGITLLRCTYIHTFSKSNSTLRFMTPSLGLRTELQTNQAWPASLLGGAERLVSPIVSYVRPQLVAGRQFCVEPRSVLISWRHIVASPLI